MDEANLQVLQVASEWLLIGHSATLGTVIRTWGSAPRPIGSLVAVRDDGLIVGSVSGGCIEADLVDRIRGQAAAVDVQRVSYGVTADEASRFGLPCGGSIELVLEALSADSRLEHLIARVLSGAHTRRTLDLINGRVSLEDGDGTHVLRCDDRVLVTEHGPRWRLLVIGAGQLTHYVAQIALACDYRVLVCDPRSEYADRWDLPRSELVRTMPDDTVREMKPDSHTAVVALTHDPALDDMALIEALQSPAFYVGAIGSERNQQKRKERLKEFGVSAAQADRLHGPVGIKNGGQTPAEIAASIVTEITAAKYGFMIPAPVRQPVPV